MNTPTPEQKLKRAFWLAFQASSPMGLGALHIGTANAQTEDSLFESAARNGTIDTDYVCGRMMKTEFKINEAGELQIWPETPRADYQSWATKYPTAADLIAATEESLKA